MSLKLIYKIAKSNKLYALIIFALAFFSAVALNTYVISKNVDYKVDLTDVKQSYGCWHIAFENIPDARMDDVENLAIDNENFLFSVEHKSKSMQNNICFFSDENFLKLHCCEPIAGRYPKEIDEIMIERSCAFKNFGTTDFDSVLGKQYVVNEKKFFVSGVCPDICSEESEIITELFFSQKATKNFQGENTIEDTNTFEIVLDENCNIEKACEDIKESVNASNLTNIAGMEISVNKQLISALGYGINTGTKTFSRNIFYIYVLLLSLISALALRNILVLCIENNYKTLSVFKLISSSVGKAFTCLALPLFVTETIALLLGYATGLCIVNNYVESIYTVAAIRDTVFYAIVFSLCMLLVFILVSFEKYFKMRRKTDKEFCRIVKLSAFGKKAKECNTMFYKKRLFAGRVSFLRKAINPGVWTSMSITIGLVMTITILSVTSILNTDIYGSVPVYDYAVMRPSMWYQYQEELREDEKFINELKKRDDLCEVLERYESSCFGTLDKSILSEEYIGFMQRNSSEGNRYINTLNRQTSAHFLVHGYSNEMIDRLLGEGNDFNPDSDCIVYDGMLKNNGVEHIVDNPDEIFIEDCDMKQRRLNIYQCVDDVILPYSVNNGEVIPIIVSEQFFRQYFYDFLKPNYYVYLNSDSPEVKKTVEGYFGKIKFFEKEDHRLIKREQQKERRIKYIISACLFLIILMFSLVNIFATFASFYVKFRSVFASYIIMGVKKKYLLLPFVFCLMRYYIISFACSFTIVSVFLEIFQSIADSNKGFSDFFYTFPTGIFIGTCIVFAIVFLLIITVIGVKLCREKFDSHEITVE